MGIAVPDHKFEKKYVRHSIPLHWKERILDFMDFSSTPPEVGIYDEPVRYFKANLEWCKFIFGLLAWAENVAYWKDADDELHHAIQQILIFEEGIEGGILMSPEEFKQSLYEGLYKWTNDVAKQIVSGGIGGFSVDEDGNVVVGGDEDVELPDDDPETELDEPLAAKSGGAIAVYLGLQELLNNVYDWFNADPVVTLAQAQTRLKNLYSLNEAEADAFVAYWYANGETQDIISLHPDLKSMLFCKGSNVQTLALYTYEEHSPDTEIPYLEMLMPALTQAQFSLWFDSGSQIPSTEYITYSCTKIQPEILTFDMSTANAVQKTTNGVWKSGHRMLIEIEGSFSDSDAPTIIGDGMYFHDTVSGVKTFSSLGFNSSGVSNPSQAHVPFSANHKYAFTIDKTSASSPGAVIISRDNGTSMEIPNVSGIITVKITDLGEFSS